MADFIYLDNAATTRLKPEVFQEMLPFFCEEYGNPAAIYAPAGRAAKAVGRARTQIAELIGAAREEIYFTSGGSEADNWVLRGIYELLHEKGNHIITTRVEHHAILNTCKYLEKRGAAVSYLSVDAAGRISLQELESLICPETILISVMTANNEVGTLMPVKEIGEIAERHGILFHTDAVQAYGHIPLSVSQMHIDFLSASAHKLGGPKGIGFLYMRKGLKLPPLIYGGGQERGERGGTLNVAGIVGMGTAAAIAAKKLQENGERISALRDLLIKELLREIKGVRINGDMMHRLPGNVSVTIPEVEGESVLILLDQHGICASAGSACSMAQEGPSHVLLAMGRSEEEARGTLRFSLSEENTEEELYKTVQILKRITEYLHNIVS